METTKLLGTKIRQFRKLRGITQELLAEASDSTGSYIGKLERGEVNVQIKTLEKIAEALNTNVFAFFDYNPYEELKSQPWIWEYIHILSQQNEAEQNKAYRILKELFISSERELSENNPDNLNGNEKN
ncbi:helix-turn-helix domain-containing protein [Paenibacillus sp. FSL M8-0228]|uniref:helix-turn-helix domain-containing protein n=1 Tax=Paenibacillus TaxID=44249 RepID=UPI00083D0860|nr:helix-turn-helix domain-containing protein [Paenibacillus polymyxa]MBO3285342.1 helix-turn-helix transcriptional regulator [Paenibacillus polymyxa]ODB57134.1 transcriptional regulator [Paenibacillus polymyxa]